MSAISRRHLLAATRAAPASAAVSNAAQPAGTWNLEPFAAPAGAPRPPQETINHAFPESQLAWLGNTLFGPWIRSVVD